MSPVMMTDEDGWRKMTIDWRMWCSWRRRIDAVEARESWDVVQNLQRRSQMEWFMRFAASI